MIGFARLMVFWAVFAGLFYWLLLIYARSVRREALEKEWDADAKPSIPVPDRDAFIALGMAEYEGSLRRKLLWGVIVMPFAAMALLFYLVN